MHIKSAQKYFGDSYVIRGINMAIEDGQFTVLVGPSGCGKSTILRIIAGLEELNSGEIYIGNKLVNAIAPKDRGISMVFQNYALYPHMNVFDNLAFSFKLIKTNKVEIQERVFKVAEMLGLTPFLTRYPRQLSGGQRQRVAMGRAIVRNSQVFLFDEPLSNLDAALRAQMRTEIKALHLQLKMTAVYVTHDQMEAMTMADRLIVMRDGLIEQTGKPLDIYDRPSNLFVAGFIGSPAMNLMPVTFRQEGKLAYVEFENGFRQQVSAKTTAVDGQPVIFGIRPEHLRLSHDTEGLQCKVLFKESTGSETQVICRFGDTNLMAVLHGRYDFLPEQVINFQIDIEKIHLFDRQSEKSLLF